MYGKTDDRFNAKQDSRCPDLTNEQLSQAQHRFPNPNLRHSSFPPQFQKEVNSQQYGHSPAAFQLSQVKREHDATMFPLGRHASFYHHQRNHLNNSTVNASFNGYTQHLPAHQTHTATHAQYSGHTKTILQNNIQSTVDYGGYTQTTPQSNVPCSTVYGGHTQTAAQSNISCSTAEHGGYIQPAPQHDAGVSYSNVNFDGHIEPFHDILPIVNNMGNQDSPPVKQIHPNNLSLFPNQAQMLQTSSSQPVVDQQEMLDKLFVKHFLAQRNLESTDVEKPRITLKIFEAQNLFGRYLSLNNQLKEEYNKLTQSIDSDEWESHMAKVEETKKELLSAQNVLNDPDIISDLQEKIRKRKQKRLWLKNRRRRHYLEARESEERKKVLHENIDQWREEIREKDLAARKAASLKHEAGGVLGEVRRKLQDAHKLQELIKSVVKLRELRKSEGEKKGVYPKTSSIDDRNFTTRCEQLNQMVRKRIENYQEEEKALRVIIMEEEDEREKKEKQERLEQKALLNLSKESDPLADFRRYYAQADESIANLIQIRQEWDMFLTSEMSVANRIPDDDITAVPPTSSLWASVLETGD